MSSPSKRMRPPAAGTSPCSARSSDVLPAPLAPSTVTSSSAATVKRYAFDRVNAAVADVEIVDFKQQRGSPAVATRRLPR